MTVEFNLHDKKRRKQKQMMKRIFEKQNQNTNDQLGYVQQKITSINDNNNRKQSGQTILSNQATSYAIECNRRLENGEIAKKFLINFCKLINKDF